MIEGTRCLGDKNESPEFAFDNLVVLCGVLLDDDVERADKKGILTFGYTFIIVLFAHLWGYEVQENIPQKKNVQIGRKKI